MKGNGFARGKPEAEGMMFSDERIMAETEVGLTVNIICHE